MATEVELKLYCPPGEIARVGTHPLVAAGIEVGTLQRLENVYYDTPDMALYRERVALRLRTTPTEQLQTVKCDAKAVAGLAVRPEWETSYTGAFDFSAIEVSKLRDFLEERQSSLQPVFATSFERRTWRVDIARKIAIWVMVDTGHVVSDGRSLPISEVELELAQGKPEDLLDFAIALATHLPLVPHDVSKAERGYQLFLKQLPGARKAPPSLVGAKQDSYAAFQFLASQGLQMWQANLLGVLTSKDQEFVHQFRVSLRRLGSLLKVFKPALPGRYHARWTKRVKELSRVAGEVRDLDVMRSGILAPMLQGGDAGAELHAKAALAAFDRAQAEAVTQLAQLQYGAPVLLFVRDLQDLDAGDFSRNLCRFAEKQLAGLHRSALKCLTRTLKTPTPERAHRFRIALKHLRYSCEFFAPLFDNDEMLDYAKSVAGLQDAFGFINDFHVALSRLQSWVGDGAIPKESRDAVAAWHTPQAQATLIDALRLAEALMSRCQPWCTECERRGLATIRRRMSHDIKLHVE